MVGTRRDRQREVAKRTQLNGLNTIDIKLGDQLDACQTTCDLGRQSVYSLLNLRSNLVVDNTVVIFDSLGQVCLDRYVILVDSRRNVVARNQSGSSYSCVETGLESGFAGLSGGGDGSVLGCIDGLLNSTLSLEFAQSVRYGLDCLTYNCVVAYELRVVVR